MLNKDKPLTIGLTLFLLKNNKILLGKRLNVVGGGEYSFPGGHLEYGETFKECINRELSEEVGNMLKYTDLHLLCATNSLKYMPIHHVAITFCAKWVSGNPINMEPNKNESWGWYKLDQLPKPVFPLVSFAVLANKNGDNVFSM